MRKLGVLLAASTVLLLTGCAGGAPEDTFVSSVERESPETLDRGTRDELIEMGRDICARLNEGISPEQISEFYDGVGIPAAEADAVVSAAADSLCP